MTEMGNLQAAAAAERLKDEGIEEIYASTMGRAYETAAYTAEKIRKPITKLEFMRRSEKKSTGFWRKRALSMKETASFARRRGPRPLPCSVTAGQEPAHCPTFWECFFPMYARCCLMNIHPLRS
ncbi:MAG: histidine phosphatase family protein [Lachnospiraceae bacterium]|nr:histidine phosphatase family protein [Lachnospiraceae bacterium]